MGINMITVLRSIIFDIIFYIFNILFMGICLPFLLGPQSWCAHISSVWSLCISWLLKTIVGLKHKVEGLENLPPPPYIIACKHQSAWETILFFPIVFNICFVLKKELKWMPLINFYFNRLGFIYIDRKSGIKALKSLISGAQKVVLDKRVILIFPEGSRANPGAKTTYQPGISALYNALKVPVVPVALNSGLFWGRRSLIKKPGLMTLKILPPISANKPKDEFMKELQTTIESHSNSLI